MGIFQKNWRGGKMNAFQGKHTYIEIQTDLSEYENIILDICIDANQ